MSNTMNERGSARVTIAAPPEEVYAVVSDVTRMGEFSPECVRCEWVGGATGPEAGARFHGYNKIGDFEWDVPCEVRRAEPGTVFEFAAAPELGEQATIWTFTMEGTDGGTELTESFYAPLVNVDGSNSNVPGRDEMLRNGCERTVAAVKEMVEGTSSE